MANSRFFLDTRRAKDGSTSLLKVAIAHQGQTAYISLDMRLLSSQWDADKAEVINHPDMKFLNIRIRGIRCQVDKELLLLADSGQLARMTALDVKSHIEDELHPEKAEEKKRKLEKANSFAVRFVKFADSHKESSRRLYMVTYKRIVDFVGATKLEKLRFEDINKEWLMEFDKFLAITSPSKNARNIHLRNIRAAFNAAIDDEITLFYPFRKFPIRNTPTPKRNLKVESLRKLFNFPCEEHAQSYLDMFKLMFMLIGINAIDLCNLKEIIDDRIEFYRAKTHRLYSIKVEPEAMELIEKYRGEKWLLNILDRYKDYKDYAKRMNRALKKIGPVKRVGLGGKKIYAPLFPQISTYWARHSWATIAASLDIPKETIAHALGHGNYTITDIYIDFDQNKVDVANRRVLDWVLYGKK